MSKSISSWKAAGASALMTTFLAAGIAGAQTGAEPSYKSIEEIVSLVEQDGFRVHEIELDGDRYDVEGKDASNQHMELTVDAATGEIIRQERDDD